MNGMTLILALLCLCLTLFFLGAFFHLAKLEKRMHAQVTAMEKYMAARYNLAEKAPSDSPVE
jgi:Tfp pilus assembly protein PilX